MNHSRIQSLCCGSMHWLLFNIMGLCLVFLFASLSWNFLEVAADANSNLENIKAKIDTIYTTTDSKNNNQIQTWLVGNLDITDENTPIRSHLIKRSLKQKNRKSNESDSTGKLYWNSQNKVCSLVGNCASNVHKTLPVCYCDMYCSVFRDCCFDANVTDSEIVDKKNYSKLLDLVECNYDRRLYGTKNNIGYHVIQKCPQTYTDLELKQKCEFSNLTQPVTAPDGISYSNEYCAMCNNVTGYQYWSTVIFKASCPRLDLVAMNGSSVKDRLVFLKQHCPTWRFTPSKNSKPRVCRRFSHPNTNCSTFLNPVWIISNYSMYRNQLCIPDLQYDLDFHCAIPSDIPPYEKVFADIAITILFRMHPPIRVEDTKGCQSSETYHKDSVNIT